MSTLHGYPITRLEKRIDYAHKKAVAKRKAWRDLRGNASPAGWMSDEQLEAITPKMVSAKEIRDAVVLANAAPELLQACERLIEWAEAGCDPSRIALNNALAAIRKARAD